MHFERGGLDLFAATMDRPYAGCLNNAAMARTHIGAAADWVLDR